MAKWRIAMLAVLASAALGGVRLAAAVTPCVADGTTLCIDDAPGDQRYQLRATYQTAQGGGLSGNGHAVSLAPVGLSGGGAFWFFAASNPEMLVKVLNGCGVDGHHWVFAAATTNVGFSLVVTDTFTGATQTYTNADLTLAAPIQDTAAFDCSDPCSNGDLATHIDTFTVAQGSPSLGSPQSFAWSLSGAGPFTQSLSGTELTGVSLAGSDRTYSFSPQVSGPHTATLAVSGRCGSDSKSIDYDVLATCTPPTIGSFTATYAANESAACAGDSVTLSWATGGSGAVSISPAIGAVAASGSTSVTASAPTTYTLAKTAACGTATATLNLQVAKPASIQYFTVDEPISCGAPATFRFDIEGDGIHWQLLTDTTFTSLSGTGSGPQTVNYTPFLTDCGRTVQMMLSAWGACYKVVSATVQVTVGPCAPNQCLD